MTKTPIPKDITRWLTERGGKVEGGGEVGGEGDIDALFTALYDDLKRRAHVALRHSSPGATLDTTALVNEAFLRLSSTGPLELRDRGHFLAIASKTMRWVLMDTARARKRQRRGGDAQRVSLDEARVMSEVRADELLALDAALERLGGLDERLVELVEHRFFGGLSVDETANALDLSPRSVRRYWGRARAFLSRELQHSSARPTNARPSP